MNLAIEYLLRSGELKHSLKYPYSLFLVHSDNQAKKVITIHAKCSGKLVVKHWRIQECQETQPSPPFDEFIVDEKDLFQIGGRVVLSGHDLLWYREEPYRAGIQQQSDSPQADQQAEDYKNTLMQFVNSKKHQKARENWLWDRFIATYNIRLPTEQPDRLSALKQHCPKYKWHWQLWRRYLLDFSTRPEEIAGELLFQKEYVEQAQQEGRKVKLPEAERSQGNYSGSWVGSYWIPAYYSPVGTIELSSFPLHTTATTSSITSSDVTYSIYYSISS